MNRPHALQRTRTTWFCTICRASWSKKPHSSCTATGLPLYRRWSDVPEGLVTATTLRKRGQKLARGAVAVALYETAYHHRYPLYAATDGVARRVVSDAARVRFEAARALRGTCCACGERVEDDHDLIRKPGSGRRRKDTPMYFGPCRDEPEDRLCYPCYEKRWDAHEKGRVGALIAGFRALLPSIAVLDFETNALEKPHAVEVALWGRDGLLFDTLIDPGPVAWDESAIIVNGINPADVAGKPSWPAVERELLAVLAARDITHVAHWGEFDRTVIFYERTRGALQEKWPVEWINLMDLYDIHLHEGGARVTYRRQSFESKRSAPYTSLRRAAQSYHLPPGKHRAASDAEAAYNVLLAMLGCKADASTSADPAVRNESCPPGSHDGSEPDPCSRGDG